MKIHQLTDIDNEDYDDAGDDGVVVISVLPFC